MLRKAEGLISLEGLFGGYWGQATRRILPSPLPDNVVQLGLGAGTNFEPNSVFWAGVLGFFKGIGHGTAMVINAVTLNDYFGYLDRLGIPLDDYVDGLVEENGRYYATAQWSARIGGAAIDALLLIYTGNSLGITQFEVGQSGGRFLQAGIRFYKDMMGIYRPFGMSITHSTTCAAFGGGFVAGFFSGAAMSDDPAWGFSGLGCGALATELGWLGTYVHRLGCAGRLIYRFFRPIGFFCGAAGWGFTLGYGLAEMLT